MIPLPDWAPNIHATIIHFPIALLAVAPMLDVAAISVKRWSAMRTTADVLYAVGAVSALAAYFTGQEAASSLILPAEAETTLTDHADWALRTVWFFGIYASVRVAARAWRSRVPVAWCRVTDAGLLLLGAGGLLLLVQTGHRGGRMVYQFGVGVEAVEQLNRSSSGESSFQEAPSTGLLSSLRFLKGSAENTSANPTGETSFRVSEDTVFVVLPDVRQNFQAAVQMNVAQLDGRFQVVHHVQGVDTFGFVSVENQNLGLGRVGNGSENIIARATGVEITDWSTLRIVSDRDHLRAYVDGQMILHEHAEPLPAGPLGFRVVGKGSVRIRNLSVTKLRE